MATNEEKVEQAFETLRNGVIELIQDPDKLQQTMKEYGEYHQYNRYSGQNTLLLMFQTRHLKKKPFMMARGYNQWLKEFNRYVKKGEKAMTILAPTFRTIVKTDEETQEETKIKELAGFRAVNVFELCQTKGDPIPQPTEDKEYKSMHDLKAEDFANACGVPVSFEDLVGMSGYTDGKKIIIGTHNNELGRICTLFHELAHYHLHFDRNGDEVKVYDDDRTSLVELEAESVAYMVSSALGIENDFSRKYISHWNRGNDDIDSVFRSRSLRLLNEALAQIDIFMGLVSG